MHNWMLCHNPQKSENDKKWRLDPFGTAQSISMWIQVDWLSLIVFYVAQQLFVFLSVYDEIEKRLD